MSASKRTCQDCGGPLSRHARGERCRRCCVGKHYIGQHGAGLKVLRMCEHCNAWFVHQPSTRRFCSWDCYLAAKKTPSGEDHHSWLGDDAGRWAGWIRAQKAFPPEPCEVCGAKAVRHHIDGNNKNNVRENIQFLCRKHHAELHHRQGDLTLPPNARKRAA